jgi:hypothetical protein
MNRTRTNSKEIRPQSMVPLIFVSRIKRSKSNVDLRSTFDVRLRILHQALVAAIWSTNASASMPRKAWLAQS